MSRKIKNSGGTAKEVQKLKEKRQGRHITVFAVILGAVIILGILGVLFFQSGVIANRFPAVSIDGKNYKLSEFNYYYYASYNSYLDDYSEYIGYMFDDSRSLKDQQYDEKQSWFDYFQDQAVDSMTSIIETAKLAEDAGYQLSAEADEEMAAVMEGIRSSAESAGFSTDQYLENIYGSGMNEKVYKEHLTKSHLAAEYSEKLKEEYSFSEKEIEQYYREHLAEYTFVNYERFYVKASEVDTEPTELEKKEAYELAQQIYDRVEKGEPLKTVSGEYQDKGTYYSFDDAYYDSSFSYGEWLFSEERKDGDANVIDDGSGYYVMVFHSRNESSYAAADIIDVSFPVEAASADSSADDDKDKVSQMYEDSCAGAEELLAKWQAGEQTKESFETLSAEIDSSQGTVNPYTDLTKGTLDDAVSQWVFDSARRPGDCQVIYTESGFHTVYYAEAGREAWKVEAEADLRNAVHDAWYQELLDTAAVKRHSYVMGFAGGEVS